MVIPSVISGRTIYQGSAVADLKVGLRLGKPSDHNGTGAVEVPGVFLKGDA